MNAFFTDFFQNSSFSEIINIYWTSISVYIRDIIQLLCESVKNRAFDNLSDYLQFSDFQLTLLKGFLLILATNLFFIFIAWKIYGKRICERFMKPATSKAIEELKASVARLKLPKEHTPRI